MTRGDRLIQMAYVQAARGNYQFFQEILNRNDGKVPDKVEATLTSGWEMQYDDAEPVEDDDRPCRKDEEDDGA